ncbi:hypothetical protein Cgig2_004760 [Carnegiea gigantea]|uniref:C2 domain-containing protein n=1 Tax=Carnegiea gigantea TaxID=171969 RepID=A0A9Q1KWQ2_9CARY|nr:hypothetical protein Cgig2_004760 [Carnegiea gigantea]
MPNLSSREFEAGELVSTSGNRESNGATQMDDEESTMATVAQFIEQLHGNMSSPHEKELITARLLGIARKRKDARALIGSHGQAMPLFISILRTGTCGAKVNVAATLSVLCRDEDLRLKVLLGGCIPPLLSLLKSESSEARKAAAEAIYEVSAGGLADDHVGVKIFVTEGVVPTLWEQLNPKTPHDKVVEGFVTGALRNLCGDRDSYWRAALAGGGVDIIVGLLSSANAVSQSNAASLLARLMLAFNDSIPKVIESGAVKALLQLLGQDNDLSVRASAADALQAVSSKSDEAKKAVVDASGVPILIGAVVAPSKEGMHGEFGHALQEHATQALANICGGMAALIMYLGELAQSPRLAAPVADIIGALAFSLMVFEQKSALQEEPFNIKRIEDILVTLLKPRDNKLVQDRLLEAMSCLYGNIYLSRWLSHAEAKKILTGLITMAALEVQEHFIVALTGLCSDEVDIWDAIKKREGIQLLISLLGLSGEQHQEHAAQLMVILTDEVDDSKWAITAAGGIPPLVQLLEVGSAKAREDAAHVLWNLCCHSEDIRACVESAGAIPALLWLLRSGGPKGQEASAKALVKLVRAADTVTINQLLAMLLGDSPSLKSHIICVLGHVLTIASHKELVQRGTMANKALKSLVQVLNSSNEKNQEYAASVLADLFSSRPDICNSLATDEIIQPCMKLLTSKTQVVATQSARALGALARPATTNSPSKISCIAEGEVKPLIKLAKTSFIDAAEAAVTALANLLSDLQIASEALAEDVVSALIRVLGEGTVEGKKNASRALYQLLKHFPVGAVLKGNSQGRFTVLALVELLHMTDLNDIGAVDALEVISLLARTKHRASFSYQLTTTLTEVSSALEPLVHCLAEGPLTIQDRVIIVLSRLCGHQPLVLADILIVKPKTVASLANRTMHSSCLEVKIGGAALLTCVVKEHKQQSMDSLDSSGCLRPLVSCLIDLIRQSSGCCSLQLETKTPGASRRRTSFEEADEFDAPDPASVLGGVASLWLLSIISSFSEESKHAVMEAGGVEVLSTKLAHYTSNTQAEFEDTEGIWITAVLLSILFQDATVVCDPAVVRVIPLLALLLKSDEMVDRFFAAQAMASLVCHRHKGIMTAIANSGAVTSLVSLIGFVDSDISNIISLIEEFSLVRHPEQVVLERLFELEEVRLGSTARKAIPLLVDLLRPMPERPTAPPIAVHLLTQVADGSDANKLIMAETGALEALPKYLSLSPQDITEASISELLRILFTNSELLRHDAAVNSLSQLIAVLRLGSRNARLSAARALCELFNAENIRDFESVNQAIQPLVDMLDATSDAEQEVALLALLRLVAGDTSKGSLLTDVEGNPLESLCKILSSNASLELKQKAAELCFILFSIPKTRSMPIATECIQPIVSLMGSDSDLAVESAVCAFNNLLDDEQQVEHASAYDVVDRLVALVSGSKYRLIEASICALIKLGKDRTPCKLDMVKAGVVDNCLEILPGAPSSLCSTISELFRILTNSGAIARSPTAPRMVEPLFNVLQRSDFSMWGQHSALQALVNVLEKPQSLTTLKLTPSQVIEPLISFLESPSQAIQQLSSELLCHLLAQDHFQQDITTKNAVIPLVQLAGIGILNLQQTAVKALEKISLMWPKAIADAGGIFELSKVIIQDDPQPPHSLWESAALILSNVLRMSIEYYFEVPLVVLVKMLHSSNESTITVALNALMVQERSDNRSAELMAEAQAVDALLNLLRSHQCEEAAGKLLEALFNHVRVREMKVSKYAIAPLSQYLLDPQTRSQSGRLLAALALGDLSQHEGLARARDSVSACRALVSLLEDQPTEEMKMVAICALQNFVMNSRTNRRAVAEAGGILVIQEQLLSSNSDVAVQAALLIRFLFSNHTLQEYVSNELIRSLTGKYCLELSSCSSSSSSSSSFLLLRYVFFVPLPHD